MRGAAELTGQLRRLTAVKVTLVSLLVGLCVGCASATSQSAVSAPPAPATGGTAAPASVAAMPSSTTTSRPTVNHSTGANDVVLQIGEYHLGVSPDEFVFGPEIVLYGDGHIYAELSDGVRDGEPQSSLRQAHLTEEQMQTLLRPGETLPGSPTMNPLPIDAFPTLIVTASHRWEANDPQQEPFGSYLSELRKDVRSMATAPWTPTRWIIRPYPSPTCTVTETPAEHSYYDAPVFPGELARYPLGQVDCDAAP